MSHRIAAVILGVALSFVLAPSSSFASSGSLGSTVRETLSETVPTAFAPNNLKVEDYLPQWQGNPIPGAELRLVPGSLQWVRISEVLVVPRALLRVDVSGAQDGIVRSGGNSQAFSAQGHAEIPVALISGEANAIDVTIRRGVHEIRGRILLKFEPKDPVLPRFVADPSCSPFNLRFVFPRGNGAQHGWGYVGCRLSTVEGEKFREPSLEVDVLWDGVGRRIRVNGIKTAATRASVWKLRLRSDSGVVHLNRGQDQLAIQALLPQRLHYGFLGAGIGPYSFQFTDSRTDVNHVVPMLTLYGSYFVQDNLRIVAFDATSFSDQMVSDIGLYMKIEYGRVFDRRITINLMLGAHANAFNALGSYQFKPGAPQGFEMDYADFLGKNHTLTAGGFIYPSISDKAYYNLWLRWGSPRIFMELNYILWKEQLDLPGGEVDGVLSRSVGLSLGVPVARFL